MVIRFFLFAVWFLLRIREFTYKENDDETVIDQQAKATLVCHHFLSFTELRGVPFSRLSFPLFIRHLYV